MEYGLRVDTDHSDYSAFGDYSAPVAHTDHRALVAHTWSIKAKPYPGAGWVGTILNIQNSKTTC